MQSDGNRGGESVVAIDAEPNRSTERNERRPRLIASSLSLLARPTKSAGVDITQDPGGMLFMGIV